MDEQQDNDKPTGDGQSETGDDMAPQEKPNSLLAFLRAIRFTRKSRAEREEPARPFAGLSSKKTDPGSDEDDAVRSAN